MEIEQHIKELAEEGLTYVPDVFTSDECKSYIKRFENLVAKYIDERRPLNEDCQYINSPFRFDPSMLDLLHIEKLEKILTRVLDQDYVLINANIINRKHSSEIEHLIENGTIKRKVGIGDTWHTDSRYLGGRRLDYGFSYIVGIAFNDFTSDNGSTLYVPKSHLSREIPAREADYPKKQIVCKAGTMAIMDSGLWHRSGGLSQQDRWSHFAYYGPWFMKPYFQFPEMLGAEFGSKLSKPLRRILHYTSTPPVSDDIRDNTVVRE
jgi:ectoine hydroxylase-related dioxygenase (phytanoyl-CoA dioxygenase family)